MLAGLEKLMIETAPDCVLVYGDTNSTLAGALAAAKLHLPIAHVEAGLRSYNRRMPEEINRVLTDHVSTLLFCPTHAAVRNLQGEGIRSGVHHVGDVMYDATLAAVREAHRSRIIESLGLQTGGYSVATVHRAENTDDPAQLRRVIEYLREQAVDQPLVLPLHPRTRQSLAAHRIATDGLRLCEPVGYLDMASLLSQCTAVYTDSGGLQKEAYFHGKPCVTLRSETEWIETVECGWNRLWSVADFAQRRPIGEYGDGHAAEAIVRLLQSI
jgi:UDP-GlcNAc3NAcA epimerase